MFEFNPELVGGDDQDAGDDVLYSPGEQEGEGEGMEEGEGERGEEGRDVTDTAGYSDEVLAPPPPLPPSSSATTQDADTGSAIITHNFYSGHPNYLTGHPAYVLDVN